MILDDGLVNILKMVVDHAEEAESLRVLWFYLKHSAIINFGLFVISI